MKINNMELFDISRLEEYMQKFDTRVIEIENKIVTLEAEIEKLNEQIDKAQIADIMEGTIATRKELNNLKARKDNIIAQYNQEKENKAKLDELKAVGLQDIIPEVSKQMVEDVELYTNSVQREIFKQLYEIKEKQIELLLTLHKANSAVSVAIGEYNGYCELFDFKRYKAYFKEQTDNLTKTNRNFPEYGSPLLAVEFTNAVEERAMRSCAEANAVYNAGKSNEDKEQLPQAKTLADIDLQKFLDSLE